MKAKKHSASTFQTNVCLLFSFGYIHVFTHLGFCVEKKKKNLQKFEIKQKRKSVKKITVYSNGNIN